MASQVKALKLNDSVALESDLEPKLNQSAAAPEFSAAQDYPADYHVTHGGDLYRFTSAHPAGEWTGNDVVLDNMTTPDAMLDITSAGKLRVVAADGTIIWVEPTAPVNSVNSKTGTVVLDASDVGAAVYQQIGIPEFESTATYAVGKLVMYSNAVWKCKTAIATAGAWDASKWNKILEFGTNVTIPGSLTVGTRKSGQSVGAKSVAEGYNVAASGECSHAEGQNNTASQYCTHAEGYGNTASGYVSHAEGQGGTASGYTSHAEGYCNIASGSCAHAEGAGTRAVGLDSHAEGEGGNNPAYGAKGTASHVEGRCTVAENQYEHAQGYYNASHKANTTWGDPGNTLSSIGFAGQSSGWNPRNAVETMQDGKTFIYNLGGYNGTNPTGSGVLDLASAVNAKAPLASPAFTGTPTAPTPTAGDASTKIATTAFVSGVEAGLDARLDAVESKIPPATPAALAASLGIAVTSTTTMDALRAHFSLPDTATLQDVLAAAGFGDPAFADRVHTHTVSDVTGLSDAMKYAIVSPATTTSGTTVSATLQDRAVNNISLASNVTQLNLTMPAQVSGVARDLFIRLVVTGSEAPEVSFTGNITFDVDDDEWANVEPGVNIIMLTETNQ